MKKQENVLMQCQYSSAPAAEWFAWVEFRITKYGFSVWVGGEDDSNGKTRLRVASVKKPYSWRAAANVLLAMDEGAIYGDLRSDVYISGETGFCADILNLCWLRDDDVDTAVKSFLVGLSDYSLALLENIFGSLISDEALKILGLYVDLCTLDPFDCWNITFPGESNFSFDLLIESLEQKFELDVQKALEEKEAKLHPYKAKMADIYKLWEKNAIESTSYATSLVSGIQSRKLKRHLEGFVLTNARVPEGNEITDLFKLVRTELGMS